MLLPLENRLQELSQNQKIKFVDMSVDYFARYQSLLNSLKLQIYPNINAGLASLSESPGLYTDHGEKHFDEVVKYAGLLMDGHEEKIQPYELYILLCAIRIHDAGNIDGREDHETRTHSILRAYGGDIKTNSAELRLIADIAQAHGGYIEGTHDKDTIGNLPESVGVGPETVRARLLASIVRFSDEICEHSNRAAHHNLAMNNVIETSLLYQLYAKSIQEARVDKPNKSFRISYYLNIENFNIKYKTPTGKEKYFIDDVLDRIEKLNTERIYCNRFMLPELQTDRLDIKMSFYESVSLGQHDHEKQLESKSFSIFEKGYPDSKNAWRTVECKDIKGELFVNKPWSRL